MVGDSVTAEYRATNGWQSIAGAPSKADLRRADLLLVEYNALRSEINLTMQSRNTILTFGFAALGALAAAVFLSQHSPDAFTVIVVLGMGAPALSSIILALWLAEFIRMARAGAHVARLEEQLNELVTGDRDQPLTRERTRWPEEGTKRRSPIASGGRAFIDAYVPVLSAFTGLVLVAPALAVKVAGVPYVDYWWACVPWFIVPAAWILWRFEHYYRRVADAMVSPGGEARGRG
jgi:hypothetical protein